MSLPIKMKNPLSMKAIGNVRGFSSEMLRNVLYVLGTGYMGGSIATMGQSASDLFPYDVTKPPYAGRVYDGKCENLVEYIWPMKSVGFPYSLKLGTSYSSEFIKWMIDTCRHSFANVRHVLNVYTSLGDCMAKNDIGDLIQFLSDNLSN